MSPADTPRNPFLRPWDHPTPPDVEAWARGLCRAFGNDPDKVIGFPAAPAWRSWVGYAELAVKTAGELGWRAP